MKIENYWLRLQLSDLIILSVLFLIFGLLSGVIIGEKLQSVYFGEMLNHSANTNNLIRTDDIYYEIYDYNFSQCNYKDYDCMMKLINNTDGV